MTRTHADTLESKIVQLQAVYDPEYNHNRERIHEQGDRRGKMLLFATCEDGSVWKCELYGRWSQLHPPHRAPEVKEPSLVAVKRLKFSELTTPGCYCSRWNNDNMWETCVLSGTPGDWVVQFSEAPEAIVQREGGRNVEMLHHREFVGPLPEPEVGA